MEGLLDPIELVEGTELEKLELGTELAKLGLEKLGLGTELAKLGLEKLGLGAP